MRILILTFGFPSNLGNNKKQFYGGSFLLPEAMAYAKAGADVTVLTMHVPGLPVKERMGPRLQVVRVPYFIPFGLEMLRIPNYPLYTRKLWAFRLIQLPLFLLSFLGFLFAYAGKTDLIHANWTPTGFLALPVAFLFNRPVFLTFRGSDVTKLPGFFNRFTIRLVDGVFRWKLGDVTRFIGRFKGNYVDLPLITGIDATSQRPKDFWTYDQGKGRVNFLFVGRLTFDPVQQLKGLDILMPAVDALIRKHRQKGRFQLHVLGDGPAMAALKDQSEQLNIQDHVVFHGHQQNVGPFLQKSHAVLGGIGLNAVVQEAALSNCLVLVIGGEEWGGDIWKDKTNCLYYKPHDVESLADAMCYVIDHPNSGQLIAKQGNKTIKIHTRTLEGGGNAYISYFQTLIRKKAGFRRGDEY